MSGKNRRDTLESRFREPKSLSRKHFFLIVYFSYLIGPPQPFSDQMSVNKIVIKLTIQLPS